MNRIETLFCKTVALLFGELFKRYPLDVLEGLISLLEYGFHTVVTSKIESVADEMTYRLISQTPNDEIDQLNVVTSGLERFQARISVLKTCLVELGDVREEIAMGIARNIRRYPVKNRYHLVSCIVQLTCHYSSVTEFVFTGVLDAINSWIAECEMSERSCGAGLDYSSQRFEHAEAFRRAFKLLARVHGRITNLEIVKSKFSPDDRIERWRCLHG